MVYENGEECKVYFDDFVCNAFFLFLNCPYYLKQHLEISEL